ncbi:hypothetical protein CYMTET_8071 [Cymbomonas tetramitiformis]|uniref:Tudor domain-containing protein n=1 Tax=Cymbomonas tetramitiformis TaxID=36881 RepID=A0AAE0LGU8_9CHLO|nr:hypothetical protein CYMTET_8071 [Cymbomonas tetramitiformis]
MQLPRYYGQWWDPRCEGVDALAYDWGGENYWINPLWGLSDEVARKLREEGAGGTVVVPYWSGQSWFREPEAIAKEVVMLPRRRDLFAPSRLDGSELLAWPVPAEGARLEVSWPLDDEWYKGTVTDVAGTGQHHIQYDDGDKEWLQLSEELTRPERQEVEEDNDGAPMDEWTSALRERW